MESVNHIITIRVNETSWAHVWRLRSLYLGTGYDIGGGGVRRIYLHGLRLWGLLTP
jgi:hypothetical protein